MVLVTAIYEGTLPWWMAFLIAERDLTVIVAALWYWLSGAPRAVGKMAPSWAGKTATALQFACLLALGAGRPWLPLFLATATVSVYAGVDYIVRFNPPPAQQPG